MSEILFNFESENLFHLRRRKSIGVRIREETEMIEGEVVEVRETSY